MTRNERKQFKHGAAVIGSLLAMCLPPAGASTTIDRPTVGDLDGVVVMGNWSGAALAERRHAVWGWEDYSFLTHSSQQEYLGTLKSNLLEVVDSYINLTNRMSGTYTSWYSQFDTSGHTNQASYQSSVTHPPHWNISSLTEYLSLPNNYFAYTPMRIADSYVDEHMAVGFSALDYGWGNLTAAIMSLQDLYFVSGTILKPARWAEESCGSLVGCGLPGTLFEEGEPSAFVGAGLFRSFYWAYYDGIEEGSYSLIGGGGESYTEYYGYRTLISFQAKLGISSSGPWMDWVDSLSDSVFQWYAYEYETATRFWSKKDVGSDFCGPGGEEESEYFRHGFQLILTASGLRIGNEPDHLGGRICGSRLANVTSRNSGVSRGILFRGICDRGRLFCISLDLLGTG